MAEAEGIYVGAPHHPAALQRYWVCPRCTLHNSSTTFECGACAYRRPRPPRHTTHSSRSSRQGHDLAALALRAAVAGVAGLALGRASSHQRGLQRVAFTALAVAAVPLANALLGRLLGGGQRQQQRSGGGGRVVGRSRTLAEREVRRLRLWDAVQRAAEAAAAVGMVPPEEQELLSRVMQPTGSRIERVRTITGVLERLREMEAGPEPQSRTLGMISALVVHELDMLVDAMDYEELYAAFGGPHAHRGLTPEHIATLPAVQLSEAALGGLQSHTCAVCLEAFQAGETARPLPACGHTFHAACVDAWLLTKPLCPVCRSHVQPPEVEKRGVDAGSCSAAVTTEAEAD